MIGLAGAGDLVATALAPQSRNRRAGELLAAGVSVGSLYQYFPSKDSIAVELLRRYRGEELITDECITIVGV